MIVLCFLELALACLLAMFVLMRMSKILKLTSLLMYLIECKILLGAHTTIFFLCWPRLCYSLSAFSVFSYRVKVLFYLQLDILHFAVRLS